MTRFSMTDALDLAEAEQCQIVVECYEDGRKVAHAKGDRSRAWKWDGEAWVTATAEDMKPSALDPANLYYPRPMG